MRRILGLVLIAALPISLTPPATANSPEFLRARVKIVDYARFKPATRNVSVGTKVIWRNMSFGRNHTSTSDTGLWDSGTIPPSGGTFSLRFRTVGTFTYHCAMEASMKGTINVNP
jgi:plastocyanin